MPTAARAAAVYVLMLIVIRALGKRTVGNCSAFDLLVALMLGEVVDEIIYGDVLFLQGAIAIVAIAGLAYADSWLAYLHPTMEAVLEGKPVVEQFVRKLAAARYDVARAHLADDSPAARERIRTTRETLRARAGVNQVEGKPGVIEGERATAPVVVTTERAGEITMEFRLIRRAGSWRITDF